MIVDCMESGGGSVRFKGTVSEFADVAEGTNVAAYTRGSNFTFDASVTLAAGTSTVQVVATDMGSNTVTNEYELPLTAGDEADFYYDLNGNLTSIHRQASSIVFEWDALDRLISWSEGTNRAEFVYDGQDRRVVIRDISGSVTNEKRLLWCGSRTCQERDTTGSVTKHFFGEGFQRLSGNNTGVYFYGQDHLSSVRELIDTTGAVEAQYDYDPWGRRTKVSGNVDADFGYTHHYYHQPSRLHLALYRAYDADLGRWLSRDPIQEAGGLNLYGFVGNLPISRADPDGRSWFQGSITDISGGFFAGVGAQVQVSFDGTCCEGKDKYEFTTVEICGGVGAGGWGGGVGTAVYEDPWGQQACPPKSPRVYKKVVGAGTVTAGPPGTPGVIGIGQIGDEGIDVGVGIGAGYGIAGVGCVAITTSSRAGCCK